MKINWENLNIGSFFVEFFDIKDAYNALALTTNTLFAGQNCRCIKLLPKEIAARENINPEIITNHTGEYLISVMDVGAGAVPLTADSIVEVCERGVGPAFQQVKAVQAVQSLPGAVATWRVEWSDSRVNAMALSGLIHKASASNTIIDTLLTWHRDIA